MSSLPDFEHFSAEFSLLEFHPGVLLELDGVQAWCLLSSIQLACRHPKFTGPTRQVAEQIGRLLQDAVAPSGALAQLAEAGWNPDFDVEEV
jgi:hypothetical protein